MKALTKERDSWALAAKGFERAAEDAKLQSKVNDDTATTVQLELKAVSQERDALSSRLGSALRGLLHTNAASANRSAVIPQCPTAVVAAAPVEAPRANAQPPVEQIAVGKPAFDEEQFVTDLAAECRDAAVDADNQAAIVRGWQTWHKEQKLIWEANK